MYDPYVSKTIKEKFVANKIKYEKGEKISFGHDAHYFAELAGGYEKVLNWLLEKRKNFFKIVLRRKTLLC